MLLRVALKPGDWLCPLLEGVEIYPALAGFRWSEESGLVSDPFSGVWVVSVSICLLPHLAGWTAGGDGLFLWAWEFRKLPFWF